MTEDSDDATGQQQHVLPQPLPGVATKVGRWLVAHGVRAGRWTENRTILVQATMLVCVATTNIVIARYWGAGARGEVASATVIATIAASVGGLGIFEVMVWGGSHGVSKREIMAWARFSVLVVVAAGILAGAVSMLMPAWSIGLAAATAALTLSTQYVRVQSGWFLATGQLRLFELTRVGTYIAGLLALVLLAWLSRAAHPVIGLIGGQLLIAAAILSRRVGLPMIGKLMVPRGLAARIGVLAATTGVVYTSLARTDVLIVAVLLSQSAAGVYAISLAAAEAVLLAANALALHALTSGNVVGSENRILYKAVLLTIPLLGAIYVALRLLWHPLLGNQFVGVDLLFIVLAPGTLAMALVRVRWGAAVGRGKPGLPAIAIFAGLVIQTALDLATVHTYGLFAAAASASIAYVVVALLTTALQFRGNDRLTVDESHPANLP